jgi:hypothetical protein
MRFGFVLPGGPVRLQVEQAMLADRAGWDGIFVWEAGYGPDAWTLLAAMAERTSRVRLGTMLTPLPWRRPWKLASQVATLDELSGGRAVLAVGLGAPELGRWGEVTDRRERAELLDDGIDLIDALWSGATSYSGRRHRIDVSEHPWLVRSVGVVQRPRVPIWVVGVWPRPRSMRRVARCDGIIPMALDAGGAPRDLEPAEIREMLGWLDEHGGRRPGFDVVLDGELPADDPAGAVEMLRPWAEAGATWWLDTRWGMPRPDPDNWRAVSQRLEAGPPVL